MYAVFSKPYVSFPIVIATRNDVGFISNIESIKDKTIAVGKNYTAEKLLKKLYPDLTLIEVKNTDEALKLVSKGKVFATADILPTIAYKINKYNYSNLKIAGKTDAIFHVRFMVRDDYKELIPMINRVIDGITLAQKNQIYQKWISVSYQKGFSLNYLRNILVIASIVILIFILWILFMKREIIKRKKLERELEILATTDELTSVFNRYKIDMVMEEQINLAKRYKRPFSVIFFDIDHFKQVNDTYGHKKGDKVLKELGKLVSQNIRKSDIFGRWGGEEFLIICPETKVEEAKQSAEKLRGLIERYNFDEKFVCPITCSFGVTEYKYGDNSETIVKRVDKLLYKAKEEGRNRVEVDAK